MLERLTHSFGLEGSLHYVTRICAICLSPDESNSSSPLKEKSVPKVSDWRPVGRARHVVAGTGVVFTCGRLPIIAAFK